MADAGSTLRLYAASDGYRCHYRRYEPDGAARAEVVLLHGIQSHHGWYGGLCESLRAAGFGVSALDRRGSGLNTARRGDCPGFGRLMRDAAEFVYQLRARWFGRVFVAAVSWGSKLAVGVNFYRPGLFDGSALVCPGLTPRVGPSLRAQLGIVRARLLRPEHFFPIPLNDPELFTADPRWLAFLRDDPRALHEATARFLFNSARLDIYLARAWRGMRKPVLVQLAGDDPIIDNARCRRYADKFPTADRTVIEYPGNRHTLEFEPAAEQYRADLAAWLAARC